MTPPGTKLCVYCTAFFPIADAEHTTRPFHSCWEELEDHARTCPLCFFIRNTLHQDKRIQPHCEKTGSSKGSSTLSVRLRYPRNCQNGIWWAILEVTLGIPRSGWNKPQRFSLTTRESTATSWQYFWKTSKPLYEDRIAIFKEWFHECDSKHGDNCRPAKGEVPKRLIDVGTAISPRLILGSEILSLDKRYTTLSHCWGLKLPIRTTQENVDAYSVGIPLDSIPRTFNDAITITRELGIPYLWIDALCIVQDSAEEWEIEASKMKDVYSRSTLCIAASDAAGSADGCFPDSDIGEDRQAQFNVPETDIHPEIMVKVQMNDIRQETNETILNQRGWVLQEQLLPHRMVSCMRANLHWQCARAYKTGTGIDFEDPSTFCGIRRLHGDVGTPQAEVWRSWMENFSLRDFTFWDDRLPSLAGITEFYHLRTGDTPLLGLWKSSFVQDLLWLRVSEIRDGSSSKTKQRLPSWSWLSCTGSIVFDLWKITKSLSNPQIITEYHAKLIHVNVVWSKTPMTSALQSTHLELEGRLIDVSIEVVTDGRNFNPPYLITGNTTIDAQRSADSPIPWVAAGQFDQANRSGTATYPCLLIQSREHREVNSRRETFLILEKVHSASTPTYKRIGIGCFLGRSEEFSKAKRERVYIV